MHSDERSVESAHCERRRILNARLCAKRPNRKWITQWLWIGHAAVMWFLKKFPFLSLSGHFPKTWWRLPRRPSAGSMWPGRSTLPPPGRTGAASSQSWMRMKSLVNEPLRLPRRLLLLYISTNLVTTWSWQETTSVVSFYTLDTIYITPCGQTSLIGNAAESLRF